MGDVEDGGLELSRAEECGEGFIETQPLPPCPPYPPSPNAQSGGVGESSEGDAHMHETDYGCDAHSDAHESEVREDEEGVVRYNLETLVSYILATGDFLESTTRLPFTEDQLREMDEAVEAAGMELGSVVAAYRSDVYKLRKTDRSMVEGLENCVGGVVGEILGVVDQRSAHGRTRPRLRTRGDDGSRFRGAPTMVPYGGGGNDTELQIRLVTKFHEFDHFFDQLKQVDATLAKTCLNQYRALLTGPPNCRTPASPLLDAALTFISDKESAFVNVPEEQEAWTADQPTNSNLQQQAQTE
uniref:Uncharacterized protein n=1 Tax=Florenciella parvula TaxID=236787 RepID=A0A7S2FDU5_9STRA|mmetsp:Transcript_13153/g.27804  ORF Transcript_13153/g.27804 Transcript_13153/m.27804 type:complete len:299 (+) Transcript_13153:168-1064(+)